VKSDLATFGEWCFLAGVFLMVTGDGLTNFNQPNASMAWPWLYLVPFIASLVLLLVSGRITIRRPARAALLYVPLGALLTVFALSAIFSQEHALSAVALAGLAGIALFWWFASQALEERWLAEATWTVAAVAVLELALQVIAWRLSQGLDEIPIHVLTVVWLGKLQITWVFNLFAPFLLARFIGDPQRLVSLFNGTVWAVVGLANYLLVSRMGAAIFVLTTLMVCALNVSRWRRWIGLMGAAAVGGAVIAVSNFRLTTFLASTFFDRTQNAGIDMRLGVWAEAWQMFLAHPIVGIGIGTFDEVAYQMPGTSANLDFHLNGWHAHNVPLHILTEAGVLGLAAWIFLWYTVLRTFAKAWKAGHGEARLFSGAALTSVIAFLMLSMTEVLIGARVHASLRMNLTIALIVVGGLRMALPDRSAEMTATQIEPRG
jgi:O-antigen ligase